MYLIATAIDLFAGVGGLSLGAARAGFDVKLAVENDKHAMAAHAINFPKTRHLSADVSTLTGAELLKEAGLEAGQLDVLMGGPPCQGFSIIGNRNVDDPRNDLFSKFFDLVTEARPKIFIAENVCGILDEQYQATLELALHSVEGTYKLLPPLVIKASDYGAATVRKRVFFIGYLPNEVCDFSHADFERRKVTDIVTVSEALTGLPVRVNDDWIEEKESWRQIADLDRTTFFNKASGEIPSNVGDLGSLFLYRNHHIVSGCFGTRHTNVVRNRYDKLAHGEKDAISKSVRLNPMGLCPTLRAGTAADRGSYQAVRPIHHSEARVITPREAARLQGFPDWFQFAPTKWHSFRQIGNSVSPIVGEAITSVVRKKIQDYYG